MAKAKSNLSNTQNRIPHGLSRTPSTKINHLVHLPPAFYFQSLIRDAMGLSLPRLVCV